MRIWRTADKLNPVSFRCGLKYHVVILIGSSLVLTFYPDISSIFPQAF